MVNIYYSREDVNQNKFIYERVKGNTLLLVPDQFTLQAEKDAFFYLQAKGLMDIEVVSISRLGSKILSEVGGGRTPLIDKYGRHMLLTQIMEKIKEELITYKGMEGKNGFIEMTNDFISQLKQYGVTPTDLDKIIADLSDNTFLKGKLTDIKTIFKVYEEAIKGKYVDTEDYLGLFADKILESEKIKASIIWIYGFDAFTPKNIQVITRLMARAKEVNVVLTYSDKGSDQELFNLTGIMMNKLSSIAKEQGIDCKIQPIQKDYKWEDDHRPEGIQTLERQLYALPIEPSQNVEGITLVKAANLYAEAESAAAKVLGLVRDQGLSYKDILVICNDMTNRGAILKRVFGQYGITIFMDQKRTILHNPAVSYILSLMKISAYGNGDVFHLMKTGLTSLTWDEIENLENYVEKYKLKGMFWKKPFVRGKADYTEAELEALEETRKKVLEFIDEFVKAINSATTVKEKTFALYYFLKDEAKLPDRLEALMNQQEADGFLDAAGETAQIWGVIMDILDQFVEVLGAEKMKTASFTRILEAGFEAVEIGILPYSADGIIVGTMQRTRSGDVKAMLVIGANEGVMPVGTPTEGLLNEDEKYLLLEKEIQLCKIDDLRIQEENLAIYKSLSKPSHDLWISYCASDGEGREAKPSPLIQTIREIFPSLEIELDLFNKADQSDLIQSRENTLEHLTEALHQTMEGKELDSKWKETLNWYKDQGLSDKVARGLFFTNDQEDLGSQIAKDLYKRGGVLSVSPSRLEKYSKCPFSHFVDYGLRPQELRPFEVGSREIGDLYHYCLMELSKNLTMEGIKVTDPESPWMTVTKEECANQVGQIVDRQAREYREGLLLDNQEALYRSKRLRQICSEMGWILIDHVRQGKIKSIAFEESFGRDKNIPPIEVYVNNGKVIIEGKIDRLDVLEDGSVKIIDYKTGKEKFDVAQVKKGDKLQLMLYLKAAQGADKQPAGAFYFLICDPTVDVAKVSTDQIKDTVEMEMKKTFKMDGIMVDKPEIINAVAGEFDGYSYIVPLRNSSKGIVSMSPGKLLNEEEFGQVQEEVDKAVKSLCEDLSGGNIKIKPKKTGQITGCTYCKYRGICQFDVAFSACKFR
ncbi:MAG: PD-(D/E)XK nuclease family protein [Anaerovoracaceae bacterium]